jgi:hypothetical protein
VRFASVYKDFREARDFEEFVEELAGSSRLGPPKASARRAPPSSHVLDNED